MAVRSDGRNCQDVYMNLLRTRAAAPTFIRELQETVGCTPDLAEVRRAYARHVGTDAMTRILAFAETRNDEERALQAVTHYSWWTRAEIVRGLSWTNWARYLLGEGRPWT